jgi:thioredoxin-related protein
MKSIRFLLVISCCLIAGIAFSQAPPPSATDVLQAACKKAGAEKKNVFIIFHASWCGWCHKMDTSMNDPLVKKYFTDNYVIEHLVVQESKNKKQLENPGADELLAQYKGNEQGIPYWFIFDKDGKLLADSKMRPEGGGLETGDNTGCPANEKEVAHFVKVLKQTSSLGEKELGIIQKRFRLNE